MRHFTWAGLQASALRLGDLYWGPGMQAGAYPVCLSSHVAQSKLKEQGCSALRHPPPALKQCCSGPARKAGADCETPHCCWQQAQRGSQGCCADLAAEPGLPESAGCWQADPAAVLQVLQKRRLQPVCCLLVAPPRQVCSCLSQPQTWAAPAMQLPVALESCLHSHFADHVCLAEEGCCTCRAG